MRLPRVDPVSVMAGLAAIAVGLAGLLGTLDLRTLGRSWLVPAAVVIAGLGVLASALRRRRG